MNSQLYKGYLARKRFGQNFLTNKFVIDSIVSAINPQKDQLIVEIGSGLAALTKPIGDLLDTLIVIEIDRDLAAYLQEHPLLGPKLTVYQQDVMTVNFGELAKKANKPLRIFGNLPYNISTSLIFHLFKYASFIIDMHFMLQKEVVKRLIAQPNSKSYGRLSVMTQYFCKITQILEVPPSAFTPSPKVNSAMVHLVPHNKVPYLVQDLYILKRVTTEAFSQRRKIIRNSLSNLFNTSVFTELGINPIIRAENVSVEQYCMLANYISQHTSLLKEN